MWWPDHQKSCQLVCVMCMMRGKPKKYNFFKRDENISIYTKKIHHKLECDTNVSTQDIYVVYVCVSRGLSGWLSGGTKPVFQTFKWYPFVWSQKTYTQNTVLFAFVWLVILYTTTYLSCVSYKRGPTNLYRIYWVLWYAMTTTTTFLFRVYRRSVSIRF